MTVQEQFFSDMLPYARRAAIALDMPVSVVLAQWAIESDYGRSSLAKRAGNMAGIKYVDGRSIARGKTGMYADYGGDLSMFTDDYIRVMRLSYYDKVRQANTIEDTVKALAQSPYAESGYSGGKGMLDIIKKYNLNNYDGVVSVPVPVGASRDVIAGAVIVAGIMMLLGGDKR